MNKSNRFSGVDRLRRSAAQGGLASLALAAVILLSSCSSTAPVTGRRQMLLVPDGQVTALGISEFEKMKKETPISRDPKLNEMVTRVGKRIAAAAKDDLPDAQWEFVVFQSDEPNAFCLPGGKVGIYTGILPITQTEEGLAVVMGHEVAHATARHGSERMSHQLATQTGGNLLGVALSNSDPKLKAAAAMAYPAVANIGFVLPYSRKHESEADHIGLIYMARAGYNPSESVNFWQRFQAFNAKSGGSGGASFMRTHPTDAQRISDLKALLPEAMAEYQRASGQPTQ